LWQEAEFDLIGYDASDREVLLAEITSSNITELVVKRKLLQMEQQVLTFCFAFIHHLLIFIVQLVVLHSPHAVLLVFATRSTGINMVDMILAKYPQAFATLSQLKQKNSFEAVTL
jgi:hypothetical protein